MKNHISIQVKHVEEFGEDADQLSFAVDDMRLQEVDDDGNDVADPDDLITDGYIYVGKRGHVDMEPAAFIVTDRLADSYITTAVLRRSGQHPEKVDVRPTSELDEKNQGRLDDLANQVDKGR